MSDLLESSRLYRALLTVHRRNAQKALAEAPAPMVRSVLTKFMLMLMPFLRHQGTPVPVHLDVDSIDFALMAWHLAEIVFIEGETPIGPRLAAWQQQHMAAPTGLENPAAVKALQEARAPERAAPYWSVARSETTSRQGKGEVVVEIAHCLEA